MLVRIIWLLLCCLTLAPRYVAASDRPNIVFFFIDDLGWADLGYQGSDFYETPHIDALAASGMVFTDAYACGPNCAPSRACLLSGMYTPRHGVYTVGDPRRGNHPFRRLEPAENQTVLGDEFVTWAEVLDDHGYVLASMGKWHLGSDPTTQGFDINIAGKQWGSPSGGGYHSPYRYPNLEQEAPGEYLTDRLTDEALKFLEAQQDQPFLLYLSHYAVHTPIQAVDEITAKYRAKAPGRHHNNAQYAAMIESVDQSVARVVAKIDELGLKQDTVIVFYSDNGGFVGATSNYPLRGAKGMLYEGGIRVPLIVRWPGVTTPGSCSGEPVIGVDLYPTFLEMTQSVPAKGDASDGRSLVPLLRSPTAKFDREAIFWHFPCYLAGSGDPHGGPFRTTPAGAVRSGDWKLIEWFETGRLELYQLSSDPSEAHDRSRTDQAKLQELRAIMNKWRDHVAAPIPTTPNPRYDPAAKPAAGKPRKGGKRRGRAPSAGSASGR